MKYLKFVFILFGLFDIFAAYSTYINTPASKSPSAIVKAKKLLNDSLHLNQEDGLMAESVAQAALLNTKN